jgi:hypothetical protein
MRSIAAGTAARQWRFMESTQPDAAGPAAQFLIP